MTSMEAYLQYTSGLISGDGDVTDTPTAEYLTRFMSEFHGFIARVYTVLPRNA
jgi:chromate reductase